MSETSPAYGTPDESDERGAAREHLKAKQAFRNHVVLWALVSVIMIVIWAATGADYFWPMWPIIGWGIAVGWNAYAVFGPHQRAITEADVDAEVRRRRGER